MFAYECTLNNLTSTNSKHTKDWMDIFLNELHPSGIPFPVWVRTILIKLLAHNLITNKRTTVYVPDVQTYLRTNWFLPGHRGVTGSFYCTTTERSVVLKTLTVQSHLSLLDSGYQYWLVDQHCREVLWRNTNMYMKQQWTKTYGWISTAGWINAWHLRTIVGVFPQASSKLPFTYPALWATSLWSLERVVDAGRLKVSRSLIVLELVVSCIMHSTRGSSAAFWIWKRIAKSKLHRVFKYQINAINGYKPCQAVWVKQNMLLKTS